MTRQRAQVGDVVALSVWEATRRRARKRQDAIAFAAESPAPGSLRTTSDLDVFFAIKADGLDASRGILRSASAASVARCLVHDVWRADRLDLPDAVAWIAAVQRGVGDEGNDVWEQLAPELLAVVLGRRLRIEMREGEERLQLVFSARLADPSTGRPVPADEAEIALALGHALARADRQDVFHYAFSGAWAELEEAALEASAGVRRAFGWPSREEAARAAAGLEAIALSGPAPPYPMLAALASSALDTVFSSVVSNRDLSESLKSLVPSVHTLAVQYGVRAGHVEGLCELAAYLGDMVALAEWSPGSSEDLWAAFLRGEGVAEARVADAVPTGGAPSDDAGASVLPASSLRRWRAIR